MTEREKKILKEAKERGALYVQKKYPTSHDSDLIWFWVYFSNKHRYIVDVMHASDYSIKNYELFDSLEFNKTYLLNELLLGFHQEKLNIWQELKNTKKSAGRCMLVVTN